MKIEETTAIVSGYPLHRLILRPEHSPKGGLIFFHGQGDFIDRYPPILAPFVNAGITCLLTDLPGHGRSPGTRGAVPNLDLVDDLLAHAISELEMPLSIAGHSMGGLLALRALLRHPAQFRNAWVSSPLLDPMHQARPWMRTLLPFLAPLLPWLTVSTGVRYADCRDGSAPVEEKETPLHHSRISLGWGRILATVAEEVESRFPGLPKDTDILFTQGSEDPICPPEFLRERLVKVAHETITYAEIAGALHEPFTDSTEELFRTTLINWISDCLSETRPS